MPNGEEALLSGEEEGSVVCVCGGGLFPVGDETQISFGYDAFSPAPGSFWGRICRVSALQGEEIH